MCRAALQGGPRTTTDLAKYVMAVKGLDAADRVLARSIAFSVLRSLRGLFRRGVIQRARHRNRCVTLV